MQSKVYVSETQARGKIEYSVAEMGPMSNSVLSKIRQKRKNGDKHYYCSWNKKVLIWHV